MSVNNMPIILGKRNSIMTRVQQKNTATYFMGCPCHVLQNTSMKAAEVFAKVKTIDPFVLTCGMQFPRRNAIIKRDVSIRSTFFALRVDVQYRSLWQ